MNLRAIKNRANLKTIETLAEYGADPDMKDREGQSPLAEAITIPDPKGTAISELFGRGALGRG